MVYIVIIICYYVLKFVNWDSFLGYRFEYVHMLIDYYNFNWPLKFGELFGIKKKLRLKKSFKKVLSCEILHTKIWMLHTLLIKIKITYNIKSRKWNFTLFEFLSESKLWYTQKLTQHPSKKLLKWILFCATWINHFPLNSCNWAGNNKWFMLRILRTFHM